LYLPDGTMLDLDKGAHVVREAVRALCRLPQNPVSLLPELPKTLPRSSTDTPVRRSAGQEGHQDCISSYNHSTDINASFKRSGGPRRLPSASFQNPQSHFPVPPQIPP